MVYRSISSDPEFPMRIDLRPDTVTSACRATRAIRRRRISRRRSDRQLWGLARIARQRRDRLALPARPVLPHDVLVLRLPHHDHRATPRSPTIWRVLQREIELVARAARRRMPVRPHPFRRRHADHHDARDFVGSDRTCSRSASPSPPEAEIAVEIDPRTLTPAMIARARPRRRHAGQPWRAELRSGRAARHQPGAELRADRRRGGRAARGRRIAASIST